MVHPLHPPAPPDPRDQLAFHTDVTFARRVFLPFSRFILWTLFSWKARGMEHFPSTGGVILASNHLSLFDMFCFQHSLPRMLFYMGKAELYESPFTSWFFRQLGSFPVRRGEKDAWAMNYAARLLASGHVMGIFPEGTRSRHGRGLMPGKTGAARLAIGGHHPILPAAISGTERAFERFPRRMRVTVTYGPPIYPDPDEGALSLTDRMMYALAALLPPDYRGVYSEPPPGP